MQLNCNILYCNNIATLLFSKKTKTLCKITLQWMNWNDETQKSMYYYYHYFETKKKNLTSPIPILHNYYCKNLFLPPISRTSVCLIFVFWITSKTIPTTKKSTTLTPQHHGLVLSHLDLFKQRFCMMNFEKSISERWFGAIQHNLRM